MLLGIARSAPAHRLAGPVSIATFGDETKLQACIYYPFAVFLKLVSAGQGALIQGMRRIADMAKMGVLGSLFGTFATIALVYFLGERGVVPSLVAVAAMSLLVSWWYSRKIPIETPSSHFFRRKARSVGSPKLGFAFMVSSVLMMGSAYAVRIIVLHKARFGSHGVVSICLDPWWAIRRDDITGDGSGLLSSLNCDCERPSTVQPPRE